MGLRRGKGNSKDQTILTVEEAFDSAQGKVLQHPIKETVAGFKYFTFSPIHGLPGFSEENEGVLKKHALSLSEGARPVLP